PRGGYAANRRGRPGRSVDAVLLQLVVERALADAEQLRGAPPVAIDARERREDRLALELDERLDRTGRDAGLHRRFLDPQVLRLDHVAVGEDRGALERVRELAHVAAPARLEQALLRLR